MGMTRKQVIEELQKMLDYYSIRQDSTLEREQALVYAISSLKTDEAYQLMYEGGEIFTKNEVIALLIKILIRINNMYLDIDSMECIKYVIEEEINSLRGEENEENEKNNIRYNDNT